MLLTVRVLLPCLGIAAVAAAAAIGRAHLVLVMSMRGLLEAVDAEHAGGVHATLPATVRGLAILEYTSTHGRGIVLLAQTIERLLGMRTPDELLQRVDDQGLAGGLVEEVFA